MGCAWREMYSGALRQTTSLHPTKERKDVPLYSMWTTEEVAYPGGLLRSGLCCTVGPRLAGTRCWCL